MAMTTSQRARISKTIQIVIFVAVIAVVVLPVDWDKTGYAFFSFDKLGPMFPDLILIGLKNTIFYTIISFAFGLVLGLILALMKMASFAPYRWFATGFIEFFRGIPAILVLLAFGFGLPQAFGTNWPQPVNVMFALGLVSSAYIAETLRAGLQAVPKGQTEAARSLGMPSMAGHGHHRDPAGLQDRLATDDQRNHFAHQGHLLGVHSRCLFRPVRDDQVRPRRNYFA